VPFSAARVAKLDACELRQLTLRRRAAIHGLEPRRAGTQVRGDGLAASREHTHHLPGDALDLEPVPVIPGDQFQAEPGSEGFF
jgi:hypothetical protein